MCRGYWTLSIIGVLVAGCATDEQQGLRAFACATVEDCADGYVCDLRDRVCTLGSACGDGVVDEGENCDEGPVEGPGCLACIAQPGWGCPTVDGTSVCTAQAPLGVATGIDHRCWIEADRSLACVGENVGLDPEIHTGQAEVPPDVGPVTQVVAGDYHTCVVRAADAEVRCFGSNLSFSVDEAGVVTSAEVGQARVPAGLGPVVALTADGYSTCAVDDEGGVWCWGSVRRDPAPTDRAVTVSVGAFHGCALDEAGAIQCWGGPADGRTDPPRFERYTALGVGRFHACALNEAGAATCWGRDLPELGRTVAPLDEGFAEVIAGQYYSCARDALGAVRCWGENPADSGLTDVIPPNRRFTSLHPGLLGACGISVEGDVVCFGQTP